MPSIDRIASGWKARYRSPDGRQRSKNFARKSDAERFLVEMEHTKLTGAYVDPAAGRVTLKAYAERWRKMQVHRVSTAAQVETNLRRHVYPTFGDRALGSIRPSELQAWVRGRSDELSAGTVQVVFRYVSAIFRAAVADRLIASSPCVGTKLPKVEHAQVEPLAVEEVEALIAAAPDRYRAIIVFAAGTGLRQGECFGITVDRIDFLRRTVKVDRQLLLMPGGGPVLAPPKTEASRRIVPLPEVVVDALAAHLAQFPAGAGGFVFANDDGNPIRRTRFSDMWRPLVRRAGLPEGVGFHQLRHFYASLLIRHGESVKTVQLRLGHASAVETLNTYSHLWPDSDDRTREAVDLVLGPGVEAAARADG
jgi:integrase